MSRDRNAKVKNPTSKTNDDLSPTRINICYIGGGSVGWAHNLMYDLARCAELTGEVRLYDIDQPRAEMNAAFGNILQDHPDVVSKFRYRATKTLRAALKDADFVVCSITPGDLNDMAKDIAIPARFGILHPVGDTVGPAGYVRALRRCRLYAGFAKAIAEHAPAAWVINYTNPMTACTRTLTKVAPALKAFGCCHEVFGTQGLLAEVVAKQFDVPKPHRREILCDVTGINHFTWITRATWRGQETLSDRPPAHAAARRRPALHEAPGPRQGQLLCECPPDNLRASSRASAACPPRETAIWPNSSLVS